MIIVWNVGAKNQEATMYRVQQTLVMTWSTASGGAAVTGRIHRRVAKGWQRVWFG